MTGLASSQARDASTADLLEVAASLDDASLSALAGDIAGFAGVLAAEPHLRRLLTETTATSEAKSALARRVLGDKVSTTASDLIGTVVAHRWSHGRSLTDGLRELARTALFLEAERAGELDDVEDQLFRFGRIVDGNAELSVVLDDPATAPEGRVAIVNRLLDGKADDLTVRLLTELARDPGGRSFSHGVGELVSLAAARRDELVATVTSAVELTAAEMDRLRGALANIYSRAVAVHQLVDPGIGGGLTVRVGDEVIDGSITGRLDTIRAGLAR